ncbi:MAG: RIP metalloprotease RseP [Brachymonas sp.]|nr:RIP metalloprotease RseP [Brachymonas sp.]
MITVLAFIVAIGLLVAIHEYGHFQVARWCGVKVLRFAVGFGKPILRWKGKNQETEFALCLLPLGGYVKMLDEREGPVDPAERHLAFNTQPVWKRFAIVAAGPIANLLLAAGLYTGMAWHGMQQAQPIVAQPPANSLAAKAGLRSGDKVLQWRHASADDWQPVVSLEQLSWNLSQAALDRRNVALEVRSTLAGDANASKERTIVIPLSEIQPGQEADEGFARLIGVGSPWMPPVVRKTIADGAAARAGVRDQDLVLSINQQPVDDALQLQQLIGSDLSGQAQSWQVKRGEQKLNLQVTPNLETVNGKQVARVGIYFGAAPATVMVRYGLFEGLRYGVKQVWDVALISIKGFVKMLSGQISVKNLSGPITIADYAGRSAQAGWSAYIAFLGLISVSLGVLNLLPVPVLDGGHLIYYLWEAAAGRPVSEAWQLRLQKAGLILLGCMMLIATFNDIARHFH